jgi:hypothetical protein
MVRELKAATNDLDWPRKIRGVAAGRKWDHRSQLIKPRLYATAAKSPFLQETNRRCIDLILSLRPSS